MSKYRYNNNNNNKCDKHWLKDAYGILSVPVFPHIFILAFLPVKCVKLSTYISEPTLNMPVTSFELQPVALVKFINTQTHTQYTKMSSQALPL